MAHLTISDLKHRKGTTVPKEVDVAVVGGGVSGLYATWRLINEKGIDNIVIFEQLNRTGGRLDSDVIKFGNGDEVKEEEGGMRFTFDSMNQLMALFLTLGLDDQIVPFPMNSGGNNRLYFRGESFDNGTSMENNYAIWSTLYNLLPQEQGYNPKSIISTVFNRILSVNPDFPKPGEVRQPEFWQRFRLECQWKGVSLKDWTMWGLLSDMGYSNECITMLYRLLGFNGTFLSTMNAGVAYQLLEDFPADPKFRTLRNGFSTLTNALAERIPKKTIRLNTTVDNIQKGADGKYKLFYSVKEADGTLTAGSIVADKVLLCLPRLAMEKLFVRSDAFGQLGDKEAVKLWNNLQSTSNQPLLKINLYYDKAWWGSRISGRSAIEFGPNFSDLPLGSVYPFYTIKDEVAAAIEYAKWLKDNGKSIPDEVQEVLDSKYDHPAALTIYCDYLNINFWLGLQNQAGKFDSDMQRNNPKLAPASEVVVEQATAFFKKLFNTHYVPQPVLTSARIWSGSAYFPPSAHKTHERGLHAAGPDENNTYKPYGFGVHQWALGAQDDEVMSEMTEPFENLYTCGESFSDYQGWVEGALRSANLVLAKGFDLPSMYEKYNAEHPKKADEQIKCNYHNRLVKQANDYFTDIDPEYKLDHNCDASGLFAPSADQDGFGLKIEVF